MSNAANNNQMGMTSCPVVQVTTMVPRGWVLSFRYAVSGDIPANARSELEELLNRRDVPLEAAIQTVIAKNHLAGMAVLWTIGPRGRQYDLPIPQPFSVPFVPTGLDERNPGLLALYDQIARDSVSRLQPRGRRNTIWRCLGMVVWLTLVLMVPIYGGWHPFWILVGLLGGVIWLALENGWGQPAWQIIPGGVTMRGRVYTAGDTVLVIRPRWRAVLYQERTRVSRVLTDLEASALLAAWCSPMRS